MTFPSPSFVFDMAEALLTTAAKALEEVALPAPKRRYVDTCNVVAPLLVEHEDCTEQLTVHVGSFSPSQQVLRAGDRPGALGACSVVWEAPFTVTLLRCHTPASTEAPSEDQLRDAARKHLRDGWQLARALLWHSKEGDLFGSKPFDCRHSRWGTVQCLPPSGGVAGWALTIVTPLMDSYPNGP